MRKRGGNAEEGTVKERKSVKVEERKNLDEI